MDINLIVKMYTEEKSIPEIAEFFHTYPNKIKRILKKLGIKIRDKSEAQSLALKSGRHKHPTKGTQRSAAVKTKISEKVYSAWKNIDDAEHDRRSQMSKDRWNSMSDVDKEDFRSKAALAIREASVNGSKMEKFLQEGLIKAGFHVIFHKKQMIESANLELDMYIPECKTAIEIDGPAHFFPIWGEESLKKHIISDNRKNGLLLKAGLAIIRIRHISKSSSQKEQRDLLKLIIDKLNDLKTNFPSINERFFEITVGD
jgi:very-short-patch-repair endonuclease